MAAEDGEMVFDGVLEEGKSEKSALILGVFLHSPLEALAHTLGSQSN